VVLGLAFAVLAFQRHGFTARWWALLPLLGVLAALAVVDFTTKMIPDVLTLPAIAYALTLAAIVNGGPSVIQAGFGVVVGGGFLLVLAVVTRGGIGGGDIKLVAMLGSALGWKGALLAFALSQLGGGVVVLYLLLTGRAERRKPLAIGALISLIGAGMLAGGG
jgi:prepilin signal peptidase PulO-like enzyme (type II secretory pathway)